MGEIMTTLVLIILFTVAGGLISVAAAGLILLIPGHSLGKLLPSLVSYAIGALLGAALLGLIPHALEHDGVNPGTIMGTLLFGILVFFLLEKLVLWRHCHHDDCAAHSPDSHHHASKKDPSGLLIVIGDATHNFVDGVMIAAAFLTDVRVGIMAGLAAIAHEIPQEVGDFAILLNSGYSRLKAMLFNVLSSMSTLVGGILAFVALPYVESSLPYILTFAAASFIYIAVADLIPGLHERAEIKATAHQLILIAAGVLTIIISHEALEHLPEDLDAHASFIEHFVDNPTDEFRAHHH